VSKGKKPIDGSESEIEEEDVSFGGSESGGRDDDSEIESEGGGRPLAVSRDGELDNPDDAPKPKANKYDDEGDFDFSGRILGYRSVPPKERPKTTTDTAITTTSQEDDEEDEEKLDSLDLGDAVDKNRVRVLKKWLVDEHKNKKLDDEDSSGSSRSDADDASDKADISDEDEGSSTGESADPDSGGLTAPRGRGALASSDKDSDIKRDKKGSGMLQSLDAVGKGAGYAALGVGAVSSVASPVMKFWGEDIVGSIAPEGTNTKSAAESGKDAASMVSMFGKAAGALSGGIKLGTGSYKAATSRNRYKKSVEKRKAVSGGAGVIGGLTGVFSGLAGLGAFGDRKSEGAGIAGGVLDMVSGTSSLVSSSLDFSANRAEAGGHRNVSRDTDNYAEYNKDFAKANLSESRKKIAALRRAREGAAPNSRAEINRQIAEAKKQRNTAKAQKYAMEQASRMHARRSDNHGKGGWGLAAGITGFLGSLAGGIGKIMGDNGLWGGTILPAIAGVLGVIGSGLKIADKIHTSKAEKKQKNAIKGEKLSIVDDYLKEKIPKIKKQAKERYNAARASKNPSAEEASDIAQFNVKAGQELVISDDEAARIALMRLGGKLSDSDGPVGDADKAIAFDYLTEKRAKNILRAAPNARKNMLKSLGIDDYDNATLEDVVKALKGEF
jgi:hypothetical protein